MRKSALWSAALLILLIGAVAIIGSGVFVQPSPEVVAAVKRGLTFNDTIPQSMLERLDNTRVLVFGETHYVQEHQEYVSELLVLLSPLGFRTYLQEGMHAIGWIANDYVHGVIDDLPRALYMFDGYLLRELREYNASVPANQRISFHHVDINHWIGIFREAIDVIEKRIDTRDFFAEILAAEDDSPDYERALQRSLARLREERSKYASRWSEAWVARIDELLEVELASLAIRRNWDSAERELWIRELTKRRIDATALKVVVNAGMNHAQKRYFRGMGPGGSYELQGEMIAANYPSYHVAFFGVRGEAKSSFLDREARSFDLVRQTRKDDLVNVVARQMAGRIAWLPLDDPIFANPMRLDGNRVIPADQFDALVFYPEITLMESLKESE